MSSINYHNRRQNRRDDSAFPLGFSSQQHEGFFSHKTKLSPLVSGLENPKLKEAAVQVNTWLREDFPTTYNRPTVKDIRHALRKAMSQAWRLDLPTIKAALKTAFVVYRMSSTSTLCPGFFGHKERGESIVQLACCLNREFSHDPTTHTLEKIREALTDKSILILGDDVGSTTEILREKFNCNAFGIEKDSFAVWCGKHGLFTENGKANEHIYRSNVWDLVINRNAEPIPTLNQKFDMVFSHWLFSLGSGLEIMRCNEQDFLIPVEHNNTLKSFMVTLDSMVNMCTVEIINYFDQFLLPDGVQLYTNPDLVPRIHNLDTCRRFSEYTFASNTSKNAITQKGFLLLAPET